MQVKRAAIPSCSDIRTGKSRRQPLGAFWRRQSGGLAIYAALSLPLIAGMVGVGLDMSVWYSMKREVQGVADAAVVTAAHTIFQGGTETDATTAAEALAVRNGYDDTVAGNQITLTYNSVTTGAITETVQGTVRVAAPMYFAGLFLDEIHVAAGAAAGLQQLGQQCVLALHTSAPGTITFEGNTDADVGCGVASNSSHVSQSIIVSGSAVLTANPVQAKGDIEISESGVVNSEFPLMPWSPAVADPYAGWTMPPMPAACDYNGEAVGPAETVTYTQLNAEGTRFCGGLDLRGTVTFEAGIYFIDGDTLRINSQANVDASAGVTFILTGPTPDDIAQADINGTGGLTINAPDSGPTAGMAIVQDYNATPSESFNDNKINGDSNSNINGVIYFRNQPIQYSGGSDAISACIQIVARMVKFTGNSDLDNDETACQNVGVNASGTGGGQQVVLVR
jgi:Flp pilus assembly protein TadG